MTGNRGASISAVLSVLVIVPVALGLILTAGALGCGGGGDDSDGGGSSGGGSAGEGGGGGGESGGGGSGGGANDPCVDDFGIPFGQGLINGIDNSFLGCGDVLIGQWCIESSAGESEFELTMDITLGRTQGCEVNNGTIPGVPPYSEMFRCFPNWRFSVCIGLSSEFGVPQGGSADVELWYRGQLIDESTAVFGTGNLFVEGIAPVPSEDAIVVRVYPQNTSEVWFISIATHAQ